MVTSFVLFGCLTSAADARAFSEGASGTYSVSGDGTSISGTATVSGAPIAAGTVTFSLDCLTSIGTTRFTTRSGSVTLSLSGVSCQAGPSTGRFTITGGTGDFDGASGSGALAATLIDSRAFSLACIGKLTLRPVEIRYVRALADGTIVLRISVPGPGAVGVLATAWDDNVATVAILHPAADRFAFARRQLTVRSGGLVRVRVSPSTRGRRLVRHPAYRVTLRVWVTYSDGSHPSRSVGVYGVHVPSPPPAEPGGMSNGGGSSGGGGGSSGGGTSSGGVARTCRRTELRRRAAHD